MCDPVSLTIAATAVAATGQVMSGIQAKAQGKYESNVANQNAALVRNQQQDAIEKANADRVKLDRKYAQLAGSQQAAFSANGIDANFGSARQTAEDTAMLRGEDANSLYINNNTELRGFDINAANYRSQAKAARMKGNAAFTAGLFGAGSTILGGAQQYSKIRAGQKAA
jgi:hypothetical protein